MKNCGVEEPPPEDEEGNSTLKKSPPCLTPVNPTNHSFFNLAGYSSRPKEGAILDHRLSLHCDAYLAVDANLIPNQKILLQNDPVFDFSVGGKGPEGKKIGQDLSTEAGKDHEQLNLANGGYDHCFVLAEDAPILEDAPENEGRRSDALLRKRFVFAKHGVQLSGDGRRRRNHRTGSFLWIPLHPSLQNEMPNHEDTNTTTLFHCFPGEHNAGPIKRAGTLFCDENGICMEVCQEHNKGGRLSNIICNDGMNTSSFTAVTEQCAHMLGQL